MDNQDFGKKLRELRRAASLTQRQLAQKVGVNFSYLSKIESGTMPPPSEQVIIRLAEVLDADMDELLVMAGRIPADIALILKNRQAIEILRSGRTQKKISKKKNRKEVSAMKNKRGYRKLSGIIASFVMVCAVAVSMWFASPLPPLFEPGLAPGAPTPGLNWLP